MSESGKNLAGNYGNVGALYHCEVPQNNYLDWALYDK